jgi:hypothetical protein
MYALMTQDHDSRSPDSPGQATPELVLVQGAKADEPKRAPVERRRPPLPTLHLEPHEIVSFPAA